MTNKTPTDSLGSPTRHSGNGKPGDAVSEIVTQPAGLKQTFIDPDRLVGDVIEIDYTTAELLLHDSAKQAVGGVPQGCLLVAVSLGDGDQPDPTAPRVLLRVLSSTPLPNDMSMRQARFDAARRVADTSGGWDDSEATDLFTLNLLRYSGVQCRILGTYQPPSGMDGGWRFRSDVDNFYSGQALKVYKPTGVDLEEIVNNASRRDGDDDDVTTRIGRVCYATATPADTAAVNIKAADFVAQRTALFGMTRTGKSNTVKIVARAVFEMRQTVNGTRVGQIIFDPDGEYANANAQDQGCLRNMSNHPCAGPGDVVTYGLHSHPNDLKRKITKFNFYGNSEPANPASDYDADDELSSLTQGKRILDSFLAGETAGYIKPFVSQDMVPPQTPVGHGDWIRYRRALLIYRAVLAKAGYQNHSYPPNTAGLFHKDLRKIMGDDDAMSGFVDSNDAVVLDTWDQAADFAEAFSKFVETTAFKEFDRERVRTSTTKWSDSRLLELLQIFSYSRGLNVMRSAREWHDPTSESNYTDEIVRHLQEGRLVIVDQSTGEPEMNETAARDVMTAIFDAQKQKFINPEGDDVTGELKKPPAVIVYVEEAHTLLPCDSTDLSSVWVRSAKEGAKFNIGIVYSTQEPSSVHANILKNTENWFMTHLNNTDETQQIAKFNDFDDFTAGIINVNEPGYVRMRTRSSRFTMPVQIDEFAAPTAAV